MGLYPTRKQARYTRGDSIGHHKAHIYVTRSPQNEAEVASLYFELWLITDDLGQCGSIWVFCIFSDSKALSCMLLTHLSVSDIFNV